MRLRKRFAFHFNAESWKKRLAYLADTLEQINKLNLKLQSRDMNINSFQEYRRFRNIIKKTVEILSSSENYV